LSPTNAGPYSPTDEQLELLRQAFRAVMRARPLHVDAMVILPDHLHCLWRLPPGDADYSGRWREIKKHVSRHMAPQYDLPIWQRRFWEHTIRDEVDWHRHMDYIHYNPVKHGLVARPADWPWSSFRATVAKGWYEPDWGSNPPSDISGMNLE
jgi:putative transposase